jgi:hypothetical protein
MGGKIKRPVPSRATKKMKKAIYRGEGTQEIEDLGITKKELEKQKKLFSKMPLKAQPKPAGYFPTKKKKAKHPHAKSKRTTPGEITLGQGPNMDFQRGKKPSSLVESKVLSKTRSLNKRLSKKTRKR